MVSIPLPFVLALLLAILFARTLIRDEGRLQPATTFVGGSIALMVTVGLRWTVDFAVVRFLQPIVASLLPPLAWLCFSNLRRPSLQHLWPHCLAPAVVLVLAAQWQRWHPPIDPILALLYFGYGAALLHSVRGGFGDFGNVRLSDTEGARRATLAVGAMLLGSGVIDLLIAVDFYLYNGKHAAGVVAIANMLILPIVAYAVAVMGGAVPTQTDPDGNQSEQTLSDAPQQSTAPTEDDRRIVTILDAAMQQKTLFRDPDLTLDRLARRLAIPSRQISAAINRTYGRNISQVVNEYRIRDAMRLLRDTELPVTSILFECGFQTKSNFNREFARVTGTNPSDYRRSADNAGPTD